MEYSTSLFFSLRHLILALNKIFLIDIIEGITSYDVVAKIKKLYHTSKVGHCGTLDPIATGVLVIGVKDGLKILEFMNQMLFSKFLQLFLVAY